LVNGPLAVCTGGMRGSSGVAQQFSMISMSVLGSARVVIAQITSFMSGAFPLPAALYRTIAHGRYSAGR